MRPGEGRFPWVKLSYLARPGTGHTPSRQRPELWDPNECTIPWFTLADVWQLRDDEVDTVSDTAEYVSERGIANSAAVLHPAGTVLLSRTASVGFSAVMGRDMAVSQDFMTWTPDSKLSSRFLLYVLRGLRGHLLGLMHGSTHKTIYMPDLLSLRAPVPPRAIQDRIVEFLDYECERLRKLGDCVMALRRGLLEEGKAAISRHAASCPRVRLTFVLRAIDQGWSPECNAGQAENGGWGVLKVGAVNYGHFRADEHKCLPAHLSPQLAMEVQPGDILMSRANTRELVGSAALVENCGSWRLMLCDKLYRLRIDQRRVRADYLVPVLNSPEVREQIEAGASGASASMQNISQELVRGLSIPIPDLRIQAMISSEIEEKEQRREVLSGSLVRLAERLTEYGDALITEAVTGQLDVTRVSDFQMDERAHAAMEGVSL